MITQRRSARSLVFMYLVHSYRFLGFLCSFRIEPAIELKASFFEKKRAGGDAFAC